MDLERWQRDLSVNLTGSFRVVQACLRGMRERRFGRIVVISSFAARFGMPAQVAYSASKAGLIGMVKTVAAENAGSESPPTRSSPGWWAAPASRRCRRRSSMPGWSRSPRAGWCEPAEIAAAAAYFASPGGGQRHRPGAPHRRRHDAQPPVGDQQRRPRSLRRTVVTEDALLRAARPGCAARSGAAGRTPEVGTLEPLPGGISSLTYATTLSGTGEADRRVVVKVAPPGLEPVRNRDVLRQARVMAALHRAPGVLVPEVLVTDAGSPPVLRHGVRARRGLRAQVGRERRARPPPRWSARGRAPRRGCWRGCRRSSPRRSGSTTAPLSPGRGGRALGGAVRHRRR